MTTPYAIGRRSEYYVRQMLRKMGATIVIRSAGSHSQADLIAIFPDKGEIWLVQVKQSKRGTTIMEHNLEFEELKTLEGNYKVRTGFFYHGKDGWDSTFARDEMP